MWIPQQGSRAPAWVLLLLLAGGVWLLLSGAEPRSDAQTRTPQERAHRAHEPELIGLERKPAATPIPATPASGPAPRDAGGEEAGAKAEWQIEFRVEGAKRWQRALFLPADKDADPIKISNGHEGPDHGALEVTGPGRLIVHADQRVPWVSDLLRVSGTGVLSLTAPMEEGLSVSGCVVAADDKTPITKGYVRMSQSVDDDASPHSAPLVTFAKLNEYGCFSLSGLHPGELLLSASASDQKFGKTATVVASAGDQGARIRLRPLATVHLKLFDAETGKAPRSASVQVDYTGPGGHTAMAWIGFPTEGESEPPRTTMLQPLLVGKPGTIQVRAEGYAILDLPFEFPAHGGVQHLEARLVKDEAGMGILRLRLRFDGGSEPEHISVLRHRGNIFVGTNEYIIDGVLTMRLAPTTTHMTVGELSTNSPWAAVTFQLDEAARQPGAQTARDITMVRGGHLAFEQPPNGRITLTRGGETLDRRISGAVVPALHPGVWAFRIEGTTESWVGEAVILAGETTDATWAVEPRVKKEAK